MAHIKYREWSPTLETQERVVQMTNILRQYKSRVSVRQLYYRLVAGGFIPNVAKEYDKVQDIITKARYAGLIDWDAIEDRNREPSKPQEWDNARSILTGAINTFRLNRWATQPFYVELWVEKAALAGVLMPISTDYHITLMVNRGYSSASAMKESADRIIVRSQATKEYPHGHRPVVLYVGDHDPSGEDMVRDVRDRLMEFGCPPWLDVRKLALTWDQISTYKPPPNPAKLSDTRAQEYIDKHGIYSWEVDSLPPDGLDLIVRTAVTAYIDKPAMEKVIVRENLIKNKIRDFTASFQEP